MVDPKLTDMVVDAAAPGMLSGMPATLCSSRDGTDTTTTLAFDGRAQASSSMPGKRTHMSGSARHRVFDHVAEGVAPHNGGF